MSPLHVLLTVLCDIEWAYAVIHHICNTGGTFDMPTQYNTNDDSSIM